MGERERERGGRERKSEKERERVLSQDSGAVDQYIYYKQLQ